MPTSSRAVPFVLVLVACLAGCDSEPEQAPADPKPAAEEQRAEEPPPPEAPSLDELAAPDEGRATAAWPDWDDAKDRFDYRERMMVAAFGMLDEVSIIQLGEKEEAVTITFYGADLEPGDYEVLPSTDETRAEHAGKDSDVLTITVGKSESRLLSERGTVDITTADEDVVEATLDVTVRRDSRIDPAETPFRAKLHAKRSDWIDATLEHQAGIREQLENR